MKTKTNVFRTQPESTKLFEGCSAFGFFFPGINGANGIPQKPATKVRNSSMAIAY